MRFLVAQPGPGYSVADTCAGWVEALRAAGQDVVEFNLVDRLRFYDGAHLEVNGEYRKALDPDGAAKLAANGLLADVMRFRPHVLLAVSAFFLSPDMLDIVRAAGVKIVLLCTESPYEDDRHLKLAEHVDLVLLDDPTNLGRFPANTTYVPKGFRPSLHHPGPAVPELVCDLGFVGTGFASRCEFFEAMNLDGLDVLLGGNWKPLRPDSPLRAYLAHDVEDCLDNTDTVRVYRSARMGINFYRRESSAPDLAQGYSMGPRELEMAACGLAFLRDPRPEGDEVLPMLPTFDSPGDAGEKLRWWLRHEGLRETAALKAREAVADRTFDASAARLLRLLERMS